MPSGKTKFSAEWLHHIDSNHQKLGEWCRKGKDNFHAYCRFCDVDMKCDNSGKQQLLQHAKKEKHRKAITSVKDDKQGKLFFPAAALVLVVQVLSVVHPNFEVINYSDSALVAQIYWLGKVACSNFSLRSIDNIGSTFAHMFPDSKIAANFSLSRTSSSYMIGEGMAPVLRNTIVQDVVNSGLPFCIHFDETTTAQVKKQMDLTLRYWSPTHNKVWVTFYNSLFFGHAEGDKVASKMHEKMSEDGLPLHNLITLVRDGPNVNKTIFRKLENLIKEEHTDFLGFVDLGSCALHLVHNAFGKGLEKFGKDIDQLCLDLHALFKYSAARREDFMKLQMEMNADIQNFQQHTEVRWLSIGPAINRILEQWDVIVKFIEDLAKDEKKSPKSVNYKRAAALLTGSEKASTKVLLEFLKNIIPVFKEFLTVFQKSGPTFHTVYDSMCNTLLKLMRRFLKPSALEGKYGSNLEAVQCQDVKLQLTDNELVVGDKVRKELSKLKPEKQKLMVLGIRALKLSLNYFRIPK